MRSEEFLALLLAARAAEPGRTAPAVYILALAMELDPSGIPRLGILGCLAWFLARGIEVRLASRSSSRQGPELSTRLILASLLALILGPLGSLR